MKKTMTKMVFAMVVMVVTCQKVHSEPGYMFAKFSGSLNEVGDIWQNGEVSQSLAWIYNPPSYQYNNNTTYAYGFYMYMIKGTYSFKVGWDDHASLKIDSQMVIPKTEVCAIGYGEMTITESGLHKVEIRVSNDTGGYGPLDGTTGAYFSRDGGQHWNRFETLPGQSHYCFTTMELGFKPLAYVLSSKIRDNDPTVMDVKYVVFSDKPNVKVRALAFEDGERSFAKVVRPETFIEGTAVNVGDDIAANVEHTLSWQVSSDWQTRLAKLKFEVLACEGDLLPMEWMTIPASDTYGKMKVSWNAHSESQIFDALLWLYADKDPGLTLASGVLRNSGTQLASGAGTSNPNAIRYIYSKMGYNLLSGSALNYVNAETRLGLSPSGVRQYAYKIVGDAQ